MMALLRFTATVPPDFATLVLVLLASATGRAW